jgi:hypothetical protein
MPGPGPRPKGGTSKGGGLEGGLKGARLARALLLHHVRAHQPTCGLTCPGRVWRITSLQKNNVDVACFARVPKAWPFDTAQADALRVGIVQDFDRVAIKDRETGPGRGAAYRWLSAA